MGTPGSGSFIKRRCLINRRDPQDRRSRSVAAGRLYFLTTGKPACSLDHGPVDTFQVIETKPLYQILAPFERRQAAARRSLPGSDGRRFGAALSRRRPVARPRRLADRRFATRRLHNCHGGGMLGRDRASFVSDRPGHLPDPFHRPAPAARTPGDRHLTQNRGEPARYRYKRPRLAGITARRGRHYCSDGQIRRGLFPRRQPGRRRGRRGVST